MKCQLPQAIDIMLTSHCNMNCPFCFGPQAIKGDMSTINANTLLQNLFESGMKTVVFSGGEPSLHKGIYCIIEKAKKIGFKIILSTNGAIYTLRLRDKILKNLDWISIPIDGYDYKSMHQMRKLKYDEYQNIVNLLIHARNEFPHLKIKIGTVVSTVNINTLQKIIESSPIIPDKWKLYQISLGPQNATYFDKVKINELDFKSAILSLSQKFPNIDFTYHTISERQGKHIICDPDGAAIVIDSQNEKVIGNFFSNYQSTLSRISSNVNFEILHKNLYDTYT